MANSKLLKEAIADAKAVKETALANAKLALEEAFTPRLQSILAQKMQAEAEETKEDDADMKNEELSSDGIGSKTDAGYPETPGAQPNYKADTDLSVGVKKDGGKPEQAGTDFKKVADINEEEGMEDQFGMGDEKDQKIAELTAKLAEFGYNPEEKEEDEMYMNSDDDSKDDMGMDSETPTEPNYDNHDDDSKNDMDEDDMDLEAIIRELEAQLDGDDSEESHGEEDESMYEDAYSDGSQAGTDKSEDPKIVKVELKDPTNASGKAPKGPFDKDSMDEVIDLEEILREMEADMKDDKDKVDEEKEEDKEEMKAELNEAYEVIKSLQTTINEVNLLNAKLLFANKLFRAHNMTNEQKVKVIETLDRTNSVREVKLVYSTLAENFKYTSITKTAKKSMTEGIASKVTKSTNPAQPKQVIAENTDFSDRFKKLAGILK
jgi:hypothetical protein